MSKNNTTSTNGSVPTYTPPPTTVVVVTPQSSGSTVTCGKVNGIALILLLESLKCKSCCLEPRLGVG